MDKAKRVPNRDAPENGKVKAEFPKLLLSYRAPTALTILRLQGFGRSSDALGLQLHVIFSSKPSFDRILCAK